MKLDYEPHTYLTASQVRTRYQISASTLWRWEQDPDLAFPKPMRIGKKKLYSLMAVEAWEEMQTLISL